jgi:hypothetical protein
LIEELHVEKNIYSEGIMNKMMYSKFSAPPKCIFVPTSELMRDMIKVLLKYGGSEASED